VWWGCDYWFVIVCGGAVITGLLLCVVGLGLLVSYCVWWGSDPFPGIGEWDKKVHCCSGKELKMTDGSQQNLRWF